MNCGNYPNFTRLARLLDRMLGWLFCTALAGLVLAVTLLAIALAAWAMS